jgi:hypothetical protein
MGKSDQPLQSPEALAGTWQGNGCCATPACLRLEISPSCMGGICVMKYCGGCPVPFLCQFMVPCMGRCYFDCDDEGYWTPDANTLNARCGMGYVRKAGGAPPAVEMER